MAAAQDAGVAPAEDAEAPHAEEEPSEPAPDDPDDADDGVGPPPSTAGGGDAPAPGDDAAPEDTDSPPPAEADGAPEESPPPTASSAPEGPPPADADTDDSADDAGWGEEDDADADGWGDDGAEPGWGEDADADGWGDGGDDGSGWGDDGGFDTTSTAMPEATPEIPGELSVGGFLRQQIALWSERLETQPWSRARHSADGSLRYKKRLPWLHPSSVMRIHADIHFEYDFAFQADRELYDQATLDAYESQVIGGESFISLSWGALDLTFGRQIVAWGHGEMLSPVDIVNPRDLRDPAISELDDIRLAVLASRAGLFFDDHRLELMVIHESYFGLRAPPLSDLSPLRALILEDPEVGMLLGGQSLRYRDVPERFDAEASQVLGRYTYTGAGIDLALYTASTLDKQGVPLPPTMAVPPGPDGIALELWHPRYTMLGHAGAMPEGDFVLRWELGVDLDRPITATDASIDGFNLQLLRRTQINWMAGASYGGFDDTTLSLEYQQSRILDNPERASGSLEFLVSPENPLLALRYSRNFLRETLTLTGVATVFGISPYLGAMGRFELSYEVRDATSIGVGYATFLPSTRDFGPFYGMTEHDRVYLLTRWDFLLD